MMIGIFFRKFLLTIIILIVCAPHLISQDKMDGFWECSVEYQCGCGWKDSQNAILLSSSFGNEYSGSILGGELKINHPFDNEDYSFEISGQAECIRSGKLKHDVFAGTEYLRGEWDASGGNNAMWSTGLCCNGRIELRRKLKSPQPVVSDKKNKKNENEPPQKTTGKGLQNFDGKLDAGGKYILKNVLFDLSSDELLPEASNDLSKLYDVLNSNPEMIIQLEGHTDVIGPHKNNMRLSKKRVIATKKYLTQRGIAAKRIKLKWYGDRHPLITSGTIEERKINRRVELSVLKIK